MLMRCVNINVTCEYTIRTPATRDPVPVGVPEPDPWWWWCVTGLHITHACFVRWVGSLLPVGDKVKAGRISRSPSVFCVPIHDPVCDPVSFLYMVGL